MCVGFPEQVFGRAGGRVRPGECGRATAAAQHRGPMLDARFRGHQVEPDSRREQRRHRVDVRAGPRIVRALLSPVVGMPLRVPQVPWSAQEPEARYRKRPEDRRERRKGSGPRLVGGRD